MEYSGSPSLSLVCPWTIVRSWEHLPFPFPSSPFLSLSLSVCLSVCLSFFLSSLRLPSSLGVPGCFCHGWGPFSSLPLVCPWTLASWLGAPSFLLFPFYRLSLPLPLVGTLAWVANGRPAQHEGPRNRQEAYPWSSLSRLNLTSLTQPSGLTLSKNVPPFGEACVCVCAPCNHRDSVELLSFLFFFSRGTTPWMQLVVQRRGLHSMADMILGRWDHVPA